MDSGTMIKLSDVNFGYEGHRVLEKVNIDIPAGRIVSILGPSGCGKSTVLRLISHLEEPLGGRVATGNNNSLEKQQLRFLFQDFDAYPWYTVWQNVKLASGPKPYPSDQLVSQILDEVGLLNQKNRYPSELSGGMRKRLGLARCLVRHPSTLLLDEPFSSLDVDTRWDMYDLLQRLLLENRCTVVMVTHDIHEAILLSDNILVFSKPPVTTPHSIEVTLKRPRTEAIAELPEYAAIRHTVIEHLKSQSPRATP